MIKFFRKIRYDLMEKNKTGKYLKYAIGEIVLVVIGILIALSLNNWNEHRKEKLMVKGFLSNIRLDLQVDTLKFSEYIEAIPTIVQSANLLLNSIELDSLSANSLFDKLPYNSFPYKIKSQTYEKVINSGITNFFAFNDLFNEINTYYTLDLNKYNDIKDWDYNQTEVDGTFWFNMGFEIDIYSDWLEEKDEIKFAQAEKARKTVFLEQINSAHMRNLIKLNIYRKKRLKALLNSTKQRAKEIIDEQIKE